MKLSSIEIRNFKSFQKLDLDGLGDLTVFVGANNSGKSTILQAIRAIPQAVEPRPFDSLFGAPPEEVATDGNTEASIRFALTFSLDEATKQSQLETWGPTSLDPGHFLTWVRYTFVYAGKKSRLDPNFLPLRKVEVPDRKGAPAAVFEIDEQGALQYTSLEFAREHLTHTTVPLKLREHGREAPIKYDELIKGQATGTKGPYLPWLRPLFEQEIYFLSHRRLVNETFSISGTQERRLVLQDDARNFAEVFATLRTSDFDRYQQLLSIVTRLVPDVREIAAPLDRGRLEVKMQGQQVPFILSNVGSGISQALMIAYRVLMAPSGAICLLEEPENQLHPQAQRDLIDFLYEQSQYKQILLTTHSPAIAGATQRNHLYLVAKNQDGYSEAIPVTDETNERRVATELGIAPSDEVFESPTIIFTEGRSDREILQIFIDILTEAGHLPTEPSRRKLCLIPIYGTPNLRYMVDTSALHRLNRQFFVVLDRDTSSPDQPMPLAKQTIQARCEEKGGVCIIWERREIENYFSNTAVEDALHIEGVQISPFVDAPNHLTSLLKAQRNERAEYDKRRHGSKIAKAMTSEEILQESPEILERLAQMLDVQPILQPH